MSHFFMRSATKQELRNDIMLFIAPNFSICLHSAHLPRLNAKQVSTQKIKGDFQIQKTKEKREVKENIEFVFFLIPKKKKNSRGEIKKIANYIIDKGRS